MMWGSIGSPALRSRSDDRQLAGDALDTDVSVGAKVFDAGFVERDHADCLWFVLGDTMPRLAESVKVLCREMPPEPGDEFVNYGD